MKSSTETLIAAMRILAADIQSSDGVANLAIAEAADRLEELEDTLQELYDFAKPIGGNRKQESYAAFCRAVTVLTRGKP